MTDANDREPPRQARLQRAMAEEFLTVIRRFRYEWDATYVDVYGVLEAVKNLLMKECDDLPPDSTLDEIDFDEVLDQLAGFDLLAFGRDDDDLVTACRRRVRGAAWSPSFSKSSSEPAAHLEVSAATAANAARHVPREPSTTTTRMFRSEDRVRPFRRWTFRLPRRSAP